MKYTSPCFGCGSYFHRVLNCPVSKSSNYVEQQNTDQEEHKQNTDQYDPEQEFENFATEQNSAPQASPPLQIAANRDSPQYFHIHTQLMPLHGVDTKLCTTHRRSTTVSLIHNEPW